MQESGVTVARCAYLALALACLAGPAWAAGSAEPEFKGKIAERYEDSVEWWPQTVPPAPEGAPNVGRDNGTQVSTLYAGEFPYTGALDKVVFDLGAFPKAEDKGREAAETRPSKPTDRSPGRKRPRGHGASPWVKSKAASEGRTPPAFPAWKAFVVQLSSGSQSSGGILAGRLEHLSSGRRSRFESAEELIAGLLEMLKEIEGKSFDGP